MHSVDYALIALYLAGLLALGLAGRLKKNASASQMILGGRVLTLPAFVASLVSTWYGGILGVGEYSYSYGLSNWLVFGLPYYLAALIFALVLAKKARQAEVLTIPQRLDQAYGRVPAVIGSGIIYLMTVPAAYILMLGVLAEQLFGWPFYVGVLVGTLFSVIYVFAGGFKSVVRTDIFQFGLMFAGFIVLLIVAVSKFGSVDFLISNLPDSHLTWHGGNSGWYIASWYVIALATMIEPAFYQRCYAAKNEKIARNGILISIGAWAFFDFLTTSCGLYARAVLPDLADPVAAYPALAIAILPTGLLGLFALALLATIMSTVDSYSFLAASTFGYDIVGRMGRQSDRRLIFFTRVGLLLSAVLAVVIALFFRSVVDIWHLFGSIGTPALMIPVILAFVSRRRMSQTYATLSITASGLLSAVWYLSKNYTETGGYWFYLEPIFPGLVLSGLIWLGFRLFGSKPLV